MFPNPSAASSWKPVGAFPFGIDVSLAVPKR